MEPSHPVDAPTPINSVRNYRYRPSPMLPELSDGVAEFSRQSTRRHAPWPPSGGHWSSSEPPLVAAGMPSPGLGRTRRASAPLDGRREEEDDGKRKNEKERAAGSTCGILH
uniref:Uncharacterized protein n=1 Tax=Oryza rufipogon TaxID=4529 RepID=A0A0E0NEL8_ORYRU